jgi:hypothetical protein
LDAGELLAGPRVPDDDVVTDIAHNQSLTVSAELSLDGALHRQWNDGVTARGLAEGSCLRLADAGIDLVDPDALLAVRKRQIAHVAAEADAGGQRGYRFMVKRWRESATSQTVS